MALDRQWYPSPNYSASRSRNQLIVIHTSEGATDQLSLAAYLANPSSQVSYHVCYDDKGNANTIVECVHRNNKSWSAMAANDWGVHGCCCTPSGASASWTRDVWLSKSIMLEKCRRWIEEESAALGIPMLKVDANDIRAGRSGVCGHGDCSNAGAGGSHFDPGNTFPWDVVLGSPSPIPQSDYVLIGTEWYPMSIFQSDADARQAAALTWWAQYLSRAPDATNLARWANAIQSMGYAGALNQFLAEPEVKDRMSKRPW